MRSGKRSSWYLDKYRFETDPSILRELGERLGAAALEVEAREGGDQLLGRVGEEGRARPHAGARHAGRARRDERLALAVFERHPARGDAQEARAAFVHFERVGAAQIGGDGRGRVDEEESRRRPDA